MAFRGKKLASLLDRPHQPHPELILDTRTLPGPRGSQPVCGHIHGGGSCGPRATVGAAPPPHGIQTEDPPPPQQPHPGLILDTWTMLQSTRDPHGGGGEAGRSKATVVAGPLPGKPAEGGGEVTAVAPAGRDPEDPPPRTRSVACRTGHVQGHFWIHGLDRSLFDRLTVFCGSDFDPPADALWMHRGTS
ncbi:hypothetical protein VE03_02016 [Pseudogymnoascus sp. 23342-1-I1]|nr:hypothetical protein VE03_02016 [Pseudogymnoascus sp. 23342-1-I1]